MEIKDNQGQFSAHGNPGLTFILVLLFAFLGFTAIGPFIGLLFALPFFNFDIYAAQKVLVDPVGNPEARLPLYTIQGFSSLIGFLAVPYLYLKLARKISVKEFFNAQTLTFNTIFLTGIIVLSFMFVNSIIIEWNANINFPASLEAFEQWARRLENAARELTEFLTNFSDFGEFLVAFIVIAIIPAIGEEFLFRGVLQNIGERIFKNAHIAIWVSAILFSTFHLQFFGFVPRVFLGALFGYMYYWSGNLGIPIFAHFINNGFTLLMVYLYNTDYVEFNIEETEAAPWGTVIIFAIVTVILLILLRKYSFRLRENNG